MEDKLNKYFDMLDYLQKLLDQYYEGVEHGWKLQADYAIASYKACAEMVRCITRMNVRTQNRTVIIEDY